uniref:GOLD domain-containing protein n=2 Tax=Bursaphelenchus xylophilus TaxID=6326 RepID=A0A1I7SH68_BURXY
MFLLDKDGNFLQNFDAFAADSLASSIAGFERITTKVKSNMNEVEKLQTQVRAVESRDRSIMEHNFERVNFWSAIHTGAIAFTFLLQIYTIRSLLTEDSKVGRLLRKGRLND